MNAQNIKKYIQWGTGLVVLGIFLWSSIHVYGDDRVTPSLSSTSTPVPSETPANILQEDDSITFSLSSASTPVPSRIPPNILQEVGFFFGGGPGPFVDIGTATEVFYKPYNHGLYNLYFGSGKFGFKDYFEISEPFVVCSEGWEEHKQVKATIIYPDGRAISKIEQTSEPGGEGNFFEYEWAISNSDPGKEVVRSQYRELFKFGLDELGEYTFLIEGKNRTVKTTFRIIMPTGPRFKIIRHEDPMEVLLYNFKPNERVHLLVYMLATDDEVPSIGWGIGIAPCALTYWQEFRVNSKGELSIRMPGISASAGDPVVAFVGDISGEAALTGGISLHIADDALIPLAHLRKQLWTKLRAGTLTVPITYQLYQEFFAASQQRFWMWGADELRGLGHWQSDRGYDNLLEMPNHIGIEFAKQGNLGKAAIMFRVPSVSIGVVKTQTDFWRKNDTEFDMLKTAEAVEAGQQFLILEHDGQWDKVYNPDYGEGYVYHDHIEKLEPKTGWFVVLGSFPQESGTTQAENLVKKLHQLNFDAYIINTNDYPSLTKDFWAVVLGPYPEQENAEKIKVEITSVIHSQYDPTTNPYLRKIELP